MGTPGQKPSSVTLNAIVKSVADETRLPADTVRLVVDTFLDIIKYSVSFGHKVKLQRFGSLVRKETNGRFKGVTVRFKAAVEFKNQVKPTGVPVMEKRAVELKEESILLAKVTGTCPKCKAGLEEKDPPKCPNCGTEPFEKKE